MGPMHAIGTPDPVVTGKVKAMPSPHPDVEPDLDRGAGHHSRIQTLLVSVRDLASSLYRLSAQLEREVGPALTGLEPDAPSADAPSAAAPPGAAPPGEQHAGRDAEQQAEQQAELARLRLENAQLRGSLEARVVIEQAKGMLMASRRCSDQRAFELLVGMSQAEQRKVRDIAAELVLAGIADPSGLPGRPAAAPTPVTARPGLRIDLASADRPTSHPAGRPS